MVKKCVEAAKFAPFGRRGAESAVRAAGYGYKDFNWNHYMEKQNEDTMLIVMDEDHEFTENIDEILAVDGIDAVNFGPVDYANSMSLKIGYAMSAEVREAFDILVSKTKSKGIACLGPAASCTPEGVTTAINNGYNMIILGNDLMHFSNALRNLDDNIIKNNHICVNEKSL